MALLVPNEGEAQMLAIILGKTPAETLNLKLYSNDVTPSETDTASTYTEVSGSGYAQVVFSPSDFTIVEGAPSIATPDAKTFSFTGAAGYIYGYYVVGETSGKVYWVERFPATFNAQSYGDHIVMTTPLGLD
jgi:hypothetical protein